MIEVQPMIEFKIQGPDGHVIGHLNLTEEVASAATLEPEQISITPMWVRTSDVNHIIRWQVVVSPAVEALSVPDFSGRHQIKLMNGEVKREDLIGAIYDATRHPIYLHTVGGTVYNYNNIISTRKDPRA